MTTQENLTIAINLIGFEYFTNCVKNGATAEEAKAEMMTENAQTIIATRINKILN